MTTIRQSVPDSTALFSSRFGMGADHFGMSWMVYVGP
jgi:uncharacterized glyoxalase superfamily protein PhnB